MASLASKAAEAEIQRRISTLKEQLRTAEDALDRLRKGSLEVKLPEEETKASFAVSVTSPPPGKRGYLFKWQDRSIGWTGTKWALRFVVSDRGRLSYFASHHESAPRYELALRGCAVRDDGWKRNRRYKTKDGKDPPLDESGAYFFVFSIYQRPEESSFDQDDHEVVPLLRFSTPSLADKNQWIQVISEACEYCETDAFLADEAARATEAELRQQQQLKMAMAMPEAKEGTLPPLYFAPTPAIKPHQRRPSINKVPSSNKIYKTKTSSNDADKVDSRSTKGYPPSKPMHRAAAPSPLSAEAPVPNYRGFFNLGIIVLLVSNFRLILGTIKREGFVVTKALKHLKELKHIREDPWQEFPFVSGFLLQLLFVTIAYGIEYALSRKKLNESVGMIFHHINAHSALFVPVAIVWNLIDQPVTGAILLLHASITWMKLISYFAANEDYRLSSRNPHDHSYETAMMLVEDLDGKEADTRYPQNVTLKNMFYFWCAPTLTYQIAFPKSPRVRAWRIFSILLRMAITIGLFTFLAAQIVSPALDGLVEDLKATNGTYTGAILADYWLRLSIANTYLWLLLFYFYFHLYLNLFAEILRFGDRVFYDEWWNSATISAYWRLWNKPVHYWLVRHVYFPCVRMKMNKVAATFFVFFLSAIMHELLVSVPFHMVRPWSFIGMMMQIPLVAITKWLYKNYPGSSIGNIIFWVSFCVVGQPMAVLLYTVDYKYGRDVDRSFEFLENEQCRILWNGRCLVR